MATDLPTESIRGLVKFTLDAAAAGRVNVPDRVRPLLRARPDVKVARRIQAALEDSPEFRAELAAHATADLLDDVALVWLTRPEGWEQIVADAAGSSGDRRLRAVEDKLARAERRHAAAEVDLVRLRAQLDQSSAALEPLRGELRNAQAGRDEARGELRRERQRADGAIDELARVRARLVRVEQEIADRRARRDALPATLAEAAALVDQLGLVVAGAIAAAEAVEVADEPEARRARPQRPRRQRQRLPGGMREGTAEAARYLLGRPGTQLLIDGYNVAMLGWPGEQLAAQRALCTSAADDVARRWRVEVTVVFDGSEVIGASGPGHRGVRVEFSPEGVDADDVLRRRVGELAIHVPVIVVTEDRAIIDDVTAAGADVISSRLFLELAHAG